MKIGRLEETMEKEQSHDEVKIIYSRGNFRRDGGKGKSGGGKKSEGNSRKKKKLKKKKIRIRKAKEERGEGKRTSCEEDDEIKSLKRREEKSGEEMK